MRALPVSSQTVPESDAEACTTVDVRQAFWVMPAAQAGKLAGALLKPSRSLADGARAGSSPPPSTITALMAGEFCAADAATSTLTVIALGLPAPAAMTSFDVQVKLDAPTAPTQVQPVPLGTALSVSPGGKRSETR